MQENGWTEFPKQWWNADMETKKRFKDSIIHLDTHICSDFFFRLGDYLQEGLITWATYVCVEIEGATHEIGLVGTLSDQAYADISSA